MKVLVIDDDQGICKTLQLYLSEKRQVKTANNIKEFHEVWHPFQPDLLLLDLKLPDGSGLEILKYIHNQRLDIPVIMITGHSDMNSPIEAMRMGATDYIKKPLDIEEIEIALTRVQSYILQKKSLIDVPCTSDTLKGKIVGHSKVITEALKQIGIVSKGNVNVLITGESGTGKELVAKTIHLYSAAEEPFVAVNCSALPPNLIESELFGHEKGAFTHAIEKRIGRFEIAKKGTLFLDEIGELSLELQVKLLRVIQERKFERVGCSKSINFDARIISATNKNLQELIKKNKFREDLYFRICTHYINIPPLRERLEDIPELVEHILQNINRNLHKKITKVSEDSLKVLSKYTWPGNVRELENVLMRSSLLSSGHILELPHEPFPVSTSSNQPEKLCSLAEMEKKHIENVITKLKGNITQASNILGISRPTLRKKIADYKIVIED